MRIDYIYHYHFLIPTYQAVARSPLTHIENGLSHTCLGARFSHLFPQDNDFGTDDGSWCESGGELSDDATPPVR